MTSGARRARVSPRSPDPRPDATHSFRRVRSLKTLRDVGFCIGALLLFLINLSAGSGVKTTRGRRSRFLSVANGRFSPRPRHGVSCPCAFRGGAGKNVFLEKKKRKQLKSHFYKNPPECRRGSRRQDLPRRQSNYHAISFRQYFSAGTRPESESKRLSGGPVKVDDVARVVFRSPSHDTTSRSTKKKTFRTRRLARND